MAAMISAKAAGPPQWEAAPPLTAHMSISATKARVGARVAQDDLLALRIFHFDGIFRRLGGRGASLDLSGSGVSGGAATGLTTRFIFRHKRLRLRRGKNAGGTGARGGS